MSDVIDTVLAGKQIADLTPPAKKTPKPLPTLTEATVNQAIDLLKNIDATKGYNDIAKTIGWDKIRKSQVADIHARMKTKIVELVSEE